MNISQHFRFIISLILIGFLIELIENVSPKGAWILSGTIILATLLFDPTVLYRLNFLIQGFTR